MNEETLFIGKNVIFLDEVESTNDYAANLLKNKDVVEGTVIWTSNQTKGKGQRGNSWYSQTNKSLTFTLLLKPTFLLVTSQFALTQAISLAITDFILAKQVDAATCKIKWPNDIYVNEKKIAGILIENSIKNNTINYSIVGIGININEVFFEETLNSKATSLQVEFNKEFILEECLQELCCFIEARYLQLRNNSALLNKNYEDNLLFLNVWKYYIIKGRKVKAKINGTNTSGNLLLMDEKNNLYELALKEIEFII